MDDAVSHTQVQKRFFKQNIIFTFLGALCILSLHFLCKLGESLAQTIEGETFFCRSSVFFVPPPTASASAAEEAMFTKRGGREIVRRRSVSKGQNGGGGGTANNI